MMNVLIVTPAAPESLVGNRLTATRWAEMLTRLEHRPRIVQQYTGESCDLLIALHATKSASSIARFRDERPGVPVVVALTGTDLYRDLRQNAATARSIESATLLIALQPLAAKEVPEDLWPKLRVISQSAQRVPDTAPPTSDRFEICVLGHLRPVKDPFRAAEAVRLLPAQSQVRVLHAGAALQPEMERRAREEQASNPRYRWLGPLPRDEALRILARSRLLVLSSLLEGGAHVIGEAAVHGVPVLASRIPGSVGLLGAEYPGYFPAGDSRALAYLIGRCETDPAFLDTLRRHIESLADAFAPAKEREAWRSLLAELFPA